MANRRTLLVLMLAGLVLGGAWPANAYSTLPRTPDNDNSFALATTLTASIGGDVNASDDTSDFYKSDLLAGQTLRATLAAGTPGLKLGLYFYNPFGVRVLNATIGTDIQGDTILAVVNGTHYVEVRSFNTTGTYVLTSAFGTPKTITPGVQLNGAISNATGNRTAWFQVWLNGNIGGNAETVYVNLTQANASAKLNLSIDDIRLMNGTSSYNESWNSQLKTNLSAAASYTGWYYYSLTSMLGDTSYLLDSGKGTAPSDGDNDILNATVAGNGHGGTRFGSVDKAWDHSDWWRYTVLANDNANVNITRYNSPDIFNVSVYRANGDYIVGAVNGPFMGSTRNSVNVYVPSVVADEDIFVSVSMIANTTMNPLFTVTDANAYMNYRIRFISPNHPPSIAVPLENISMNEDIPLRFNVTSHFFDPDGDNLTYSLAGAHTTSTFDNTTGELVVSSSANWFGKEVVQVICKDTGGQQVSAIMNVTVKSVNDEPYVKKQIANITIPQGGSQSGIMLGSVFADNDTAYGDTMTYSFYGNGELNITIAPDGNATVSAPSMVFFGAVPMMFRAMDNVSISCNAPCNVTVLRVNQPPQLKTPPGKLTMAEDTVLEIDLSGMFEDPEGNSITLSASPNDNITITINNTNFMKLVPDTEYSGEENISVIPTDSWGLPGEGVTIQVTVTYVDDLPVITTYRPPSDVSLTESETQNFTVTAYDVDTPVIDYVWLLDGVQVTASGNAYSYITNFSSAGNHNVTVVMGKGATTKFSWNVVVKNKNRAPSESRILTPAGGLTFKQTENITFTGTGADPDGDALIFTWFAGGKELGNGSTLTYGKLAPGVQSITLEVSDGTDSLMSKPVSVTIKMNRPPTVSSIKPRDGSVIAEGSKLTLSVIATDGDNDSLTITWSEAGTVLGYGVSVPVSSLEVGKHYIEVSITDGKTYTNTSITIEVRKAETGLSTMMLMGIGIGIIAVAGIGAGVFMMRRKKPPAPAPAPNIAHSSAQVQAPPATPQAPNPPQYLTHSAQEAPAGPVPPPAPEIPPSPPDSDAPVPPPPGRNP